MKLFHFPQDADDIRHVLEHAELASLMVPFTNESQVKKACEQAIQYGMAGVLAIPDICTQTAQYLAGTGVEPIAMISAMEIGDNSREGRLFCIRELLKLGVRSADIGVPTNMVLDGEFDIIVEELAELAETMHAEGGQLGVILDIDSITRGQVLALCDAAIAAKADYVRTSSGMEAIGAANVGRATIQNTAMLYEHCQGKIKVKAGGGWDFAWLEDCKEYLECGAERVDVGPCTIGQLERLGYRRG